MTRQDVLQAARQYIGVPWRYQGRSRIGLDCVGLLVCICRDLNLTHYDPATYPVASPRNGETLVQELGTQCTEVPISEMDVADIVLICMAGLWAPAFATHVGILSDAARPFSIIHSWLRSPPRPDTVGLGVVEMRLDEEWHRRIRHVYRWPGFL